MNKLAKQAIDAHGGLERWNHFTALSAHLIQAGDLWAAKGKAGVLADVTVTVDLRDEKASHWPFGSPDRRSRFEPQRVAIEEANGRVLEELLHPRASFEGHAATWSDLQLAYFAGYAMWTYLNIPFLLARPGVESEEVEPWQESGRNVASSESPRSRGYRDPQHRADTLLRPARIVEATGLQRRNRWHRRSRTLRLRSQRVFWHRLPDEKVSPSTTGRTPGSRTVDYLNRPRSDCPQLERPDCKTTQADAGPICVLPLTAQLTKSLSSH